MSEYSNLQEIGSAAIVIISLGFGGDDVITSEMSLTFLS